jgi:hypothetical protein
LEEPLKDKYPELFLFAKSKAISVGKFYAHDPITREFSLPLSASVLKNNDSGLRSSGPKRRAAMLWWHKARYDNNVLCTGRHTASFASGLVRDSLERGGEQAVT